MMNRKTQLRAARMVDRLKSAGHWELAGKLAASYHLPRNYGVHFGMRSTHAVACFKFYRGFDSRFEFQRRSLIAGMPVNWGAY